MLQFVITCPEPLLLYYNSLTNVIISEITQENGKTTMYTWILSTGWWQSRAPVNPDAVVVVGFLCACLVGGFFYINRFLFFATYHVNHQLIS